MHATFKAHLPWYAAVAAPHFSLLRIASVACSGAGGRSSSDALLLPLLLLLLLLPLLPR